MASRPHIPVQYPHLCQPRIRALNQVVSQHRCRPQSLVEPQALILVGCPVVGQVVSLRNNRLPSQVRSRQQLLLPDLVVTHLRFRARFQVVFPATNLPKFLQLSQVPSPQHTQAVNQQQTRAMYQVLAHLLYPQVNQVRIPAQARRRNHPRSQHAARVEFQLAPRPARRQQYLARHRQVRTYHVLCER